MPVQLQLQRHHVTPLLLLLLLLLLLFPTIWTSMRRLLLDWNPQPTPRR